MSTKPVAYILIAVFSAFVASSSSAAVFGSSNLSFSGYPRHDCYQPNQPHGSDRYQWESFQRDAERYVDCINEYVEAANNDMDRIQEAQKDALSEARSFISRVQ